MKNSLSLHLIQLFIRITILNQSVNIYYSEFKYVQYYATNRIFVKGGLC